jgi:hypothetical protein
MSLADAFWPATEWNPSGWTWTCVHPRFWTDGTGVDGQASSILMLPSYLTGEGGCRSMSP